MPNRILKESICSSESLDGLSPFDETVFYRLIVKVDDFGRFDARPKILRSELFPLKGGMPVKKIESALKALVRAGCIDVYHVGGKPYLEFVNWGKHQSKRAKFSKYPDRASDVVDVQTPECICTQVLADVPENRESRNENRETRIENRDICPEPQSASAQQQVQESPAETFPLVDKTEYALPRQAAEEFARLYPGVNVAQELRAARGWLIANPQRGKTKAGIMRYLNNWLTRAQNRAQSPPPPNARPLERGQVSQAYYASGKTADPNVNPFQEYLET